MVDDKGITVQGEEPNGAQLAAAARLRNDLDRDGTQDHLAGPHAAADRPDWEAFARERDDERERLQSNFKARRDDLHRAGDELYTAMENDPKIRDSSFHRELGESLKAENAAFAWRMPQAINAATAELDRRAEVPGDKAAEAWKVGQVRVGIVAASAAYELARSELAENTNLQLSVNRSARHLRDAGLQLQDGMSRDPQWRGTAEEAELQAALQEDVARRHPDRMALAVRDVVDELDLQAREGKAAGQMWRDSDLREQVIQRHDQFVRDIGELDTTRRQAAAGREIMSRASQWRDLEEARAPVSERQGEPDFSGPDGKFTGIAPDDFGWRLLRGVDLTGLTRSQIEEASALGASEFPDAFMATGDEDLADAAQKRVAAYAIEGLRAGAEHAHVYVGARQAGERLDEIPEYAAGNKIYLRGYQLGLDAKEEELLAKEPEQVRPEQWERVREQRGKVDRSIEAAHLAEQDAEPGYAEASAPAWEAQHDSTAELPDAQQNGRWTVQQYDAERGVYRDTLTTDDVLTAYAEVQKSDHHRVLDNDLKDVAADYVDVDLGDGNYPRQLEFHGRSEFERQLVSAGAQIEVREPETLHEVLERRAQLDATVLQRSDEISAAVDRARDPQVPDQVVVEAYAQASRGYAEAMRARAEFEAAPSPDPSVVADYRRVQQLEAEMAKAASQASHARAHGDADLAVEFARKSDGASLQLDLLLEERGASETYRYPETARNEIEVPLSKEQVDRLTGQGKSSPEKDQEAGAGKPAPVVMPPPVPSVGEGHNQVRDQSAFADAAAKDKLVPEDVANRYKKDGQKYLDANDPKKVAFVDKGNRLQTSRSFDDKAVEDMVAIADARGMTAFKVSGDEGFRRKAWIEGTARGIDVTGYEPTEKDKLRADQLAKQTGRANAIEKNEVVEAYRAARDGSPQQKKEAAKKHPELVNALAMDQAAKSFAKQRVEREFQDAVVGRIRDSIERDLAQGKKIPEVRLRQERERRQDRGAER